MSHSGTGVFLIVPIVQGSLTGETLVPPIHHVRGTVCAALVAAVVALGASATSRAQTCAPAWDNLSSIGNPGLNGQVNATVVFDDGTGPALYAGGSFTSAGDFLANNIAKWDGSSWSQLGNGLTGGHWGVQALTVFDDGTGPALYAGGVFTTSGGTAVNHIAKWDGSSWAPLGSGVSNPGFSALINTLAVFDDGSGPALYAGGSFTTAGGVPANYIAKWNGSTWSPLRGVIINSSVRALAVFDDGTGTALYAGGSFSLSGADYYAKWDGSSWSPLGGVNGFSHSVYALTVFDNGSGSALYAAEAFFGSEHSPPVNRIARWNGSSWLFLILGIGMHDTILSLAVFDDGTGPALYIGGSFTTVNGVPASSIAKWNGFSWRSLGSGMGAAIGISTVSALTVFDDGTGPALYAGGSFTTAGGATANNIAKWNGCAVSNPADFNGDGVVNAADLATLLAQWGPCPAPIAACDADLNTDSNVNAADLATLLANWG